jgi:hypothetical protein
LYLLADVLLDGKEKAGVKEVADMKEMEVMTGMEVMTDIKSEIREKERITATPEVKEGMDKGGCKNEKVTF